MSKIQTLISDLCSPASFITRDLGYGILEHTMKNSPRYEKAIVEIKKLSNVDDIQELKEIIMTEPLVKRKKVAISMLGYLSANLNINSSLSFFENILRTTKDKDIISYILVAISQKSYENEGFAFLIEIILKKNIDNSYDALKALIGFDNFKDENFIIELFKTTKNEQIKQITCKFLDARGTDVCIEPLIKEFNRIRRMDLRYEIYSAIENIIIRTGNNETASKFLKEKYKIMQPIINWQRNGFFPAVPSHPSEDLELLNE